MEEKKPEEEPLRRFITPKQLGFITFFILFWVITFHYAFVQWQRRDGYCVMVAPDGDRETRYGDDCPEEERVPSPNY